MIMLEVNQSSLKVIKWKYDLSHWNFHSVYINNINLNLDYVVSESQSVVLISSKPERVDDYGFWKLFCNLNDK